MDLYRDMGFFFMDKRGVWLDAETTCDCGPRIPQSGPSVEQSQPGGSQQPGTEQLPAPRNQSEQLPHPPGSSPAPASLSGSPSPTSSRRTSLPRARHWTRRTVIVLALVVSLIGSAVLAGAFSLLGSKRNVRPDLLLHTMAYEMMQVNIVERGALEAARNKEITCYVKAKTQGGVASTIKWLIDEGTPVQPGAILMRWTIRPRRTLTRPRRSSRPLPMPI